MRMDVATIATLGMDLILSTRLVGQALNDLDQCHKTTYCRNSRFMLLSELSSTDYHLLQRRIRFNIELGQTSNICTHHKKVFLDRYEDLQKKCCDPFSDHKKTIRGKLIAINIETADALSTATNMEILPGWKLC